ncbi:MAG TPA: hypothetical protein VNV82_03355 [Bryobacteraceae bacterium]|nr:hypothetical protein [Bryobacteraceae bacterium]
MNKRTTSWLLAALMALCAAQAMPIARSQRIAETCTIVWVARTRAEKRVSIERRLARPRMRNAVAFQRESRSCTWLFSKSLYQRPPPSLG